MSGKSKEMIHPFDLDGDGKVDEAEMIAGISQALSLLAPVNRERLCNDVLNTCVMAALIGGFALGNLTAPGEDPEPIETYIYLLSYITVHACTCSALISAFIYEAVNQMEDEHVSKWAKSHKILLMLPMFKFVVGCMTYMASVILGSWHDLDGDDLAQGIALAIGVMSMGTVWVAFGFIRKSITVAQEK